MNLCPQREKKGYIPPHGLGGVMNTDSLHLAPPLHVPTLSHKVEEVNMTCPLTFINENVTSVK